MHVENKGTGQARNERLEDGELSDAELGGVSGGLSLNDIKKKVNDFGEQVTETFSGGGKPNAPLNSAVEAVQHVVNTVKPPVNPIDVLPKPPSILSGLVDFTPKSPKQNLDALGVNEGHGKPKLEEGGSPPTPPKISPAGEQPGQPKLGFGTAKIEEVKMPTKGNAPLVRPGFPFKG